MSGESTPREIYLSRKNTKKEIVKIMHFLNVK